MIKRSKKSKREHVVTGSETGIYTRPAGQVIELYLSGSIGTPEYYIDWMDTIRNASPSDEIIIHINSTGGVLDTALQMLHCMRETQAYTTTSVEGSCMSAATMIFLAGKTLQVSPHSLFMFHNYSGGTVGKGGEMYDNIVFEREWSTRFLSDIYKDFLYPEEIKAMLDNKDFWMHREEVIGRCKHRAKKIQDGAKETGAILETIEEDQ